MRFFIYEFVTGGGWWSVDPELAPDGSLFHEGAGMLRALVADFAELGTVVTLQDSRCQICLPSAEVRPVTSVAEERNEFQTAVLDTDWTVVVAPEFDAYLLSRCNWVDQSGGRLLGPSPDFVRLASDKHDTAELLAQSGVAVPRGCVFLPGTSLPVELAFPAVVKPRDGAGSQNIRMVHSPQDLLALPATARQYRLEEYHVGFAASVSVLAGPRHCQVLPACQQRLSTDGSFRYLGGETPLNRQLCQRTERLAHAVVAAMPPAIGYLGIDLILGDDPEGSADVVIEVNPRLTTSYVGLRRIARNNLAKAMLDVASGVRVELRFQKEPVQFGADTIQGR